MGNIILTCLLVSSLGQMTTEGVGSLVSSAGVLGALIWYLYHTTTKTLPDIVKSHNENIEKVTLKFTESQEQEREYRKAEIQALKEWIHAEARCQYNNDHPDTTHIGRK